MTGAVGVRLLGVVLLRVPCCLLPGRAPSALLELSEELLVVVGTECPLLRCSGAAVRAPGLVPSAPALEEPENSVDHHREERDGEQDLSHNSRVGIDTSQSLSEVAVDGRSVDEGGPGPSLAP